MSSIKKIAEFPDVEAKLQKPSKQSAFERQKAEAEAKRRREAAETAAVYEDFVKSFAHDEDDDFFRGGGAKQPPSKFAAGPPERPSLSGGPPFGGGAGKRHFGVPSGAPLKSGPGSLGPAPSSFGKKRSYDGFQRDTDEARGRLGFEDRDSGSLPVSKAFEVSDDEGDAAVADRAEEKAASKPTLRLANLPPGTSPAVIKALIPPNLTVENVKIVPPSGPSGTERKSIAAIVTLSKETPAADIDNAVSALQNRYLGFGFFLSLHRHLSSAAITSGLTALPSSTTVSHPFGAKRVEEGPGKAGPHSIGHGRAYAPPSSYGPPLGGPLNRAGILHVPVRAPRDIKQLRMIHKVIEAVLEHGPEFEALLMSRPDVQRDEKWAWIWDARSEGGIWYRWRLWEIVTGLQSTRGRPAYFPLFEGSHAWKAPERRLAYEYITEVDEFISDSDYDSSDDDEFEEEQARQNDGIDQEDTFLNPIEKFKLAHLLARLPTTLSRIRKGDIARVAAFAITHASRGADEIVDMIVSNIEHPFAYSPANPEFRQGAKAKEGREEDSRDASPAAEDKAASDAPDMSAARLLGLYVVSDILSSSATSGIRHAWRYRQLFETALKRRKTFEMLGLMAEKLNWGRLRAEKWKRSVGLVLSLWEGWCVFPAETHEFFVNSFENPPSLKKEAQDAGPEKKAGRWKTVDAGASDAGNGGGFLPVSTKPAADYDSADDYVEDIMYTDETDGELHPDRLQYLPDLDEAFSDLDLDGEPDDGLNGAPTTPPTPQTEEAAASHAAKSEIKSIGGFQMSASKPAPARKRMRAMDMFADSDSDGGT
ncbi:f6ccb2c5-8257-4dc6-b163-d1ccb4457ccc [Thermothielavioides terrestris]|uniref:F6ccb2c5-8257-4dc6-b163-d1ccb4457ccc n=1 Tax=Thermothielavioides terrestris TaxID=2587410 RepID=A0A3S4AV83_9PEZI|nr:f6ccb2c5-8257-4dc6-b163-d1ccb4457ccc [Thermothielavioides terrestris]